MTDGKSYQMHPRFSPFKKRIDYFCKMENKALKLKHSPRHKQRGNIICEYMPTILKKPTTTLKIHIFRWDVGRQLMTQISWQSILLIWATIAASSGCVSLGLDRFSKQDQAKSPVSEAGPSSTRVFISTKSKEQ